VVIGKDEDLIHIDQEPSFIDFVLADVVHHVLGGRWQVAKAKKHDYGFKKPFIRFEGCFPFISFFHPDIIVSPSKVELCVVLGTFELVKEVANSWEQVCIFDCPIIQSSVILAWSEFPRVFLGNEEKGRCLWGFGRSYVPFAEVFVDKLVKFLLFSR